MQSNKIWTLIMSLLSSSIFELSLTKSVEIFVEDCPLKALRIYISTSTETDLAGKRKLVAELRGDCATFLETVEIVRLILLKRKTKNVGEIIYLRTETKLTGMSEQFINGYLYPFGPASSNLSARVTFQFVEGNGKMRRKEFDLEHKHELMGTLEQSADNLVLFEVRMIQRKGRIAQIIFVYI